MDSLLDWLTRPLSRGFKFVLMPILAFILILFFVFLGFPYDVVADRAIDTVQRQTGATIRYADLSPRVTVGGPGFKFRRVEIILPDGSRYSIDPLRVRPAWSLGWFTGEPALQADLLSEHGDVSGVLTLGRAFGWDGKVTNLDLTAVAIMLGDEIDLEGRADIDARVIVRDGRPKGEINLEGRNGEFGHPAIPFPIEFTQAEGRVLLGEGKLAVIETLHLVGPLAEVVVSGEIGQASSRGARSGGESGNAPLDILIELTIREAGLRQMARNLGLNLDSEGRARLEIGGTLSSPEMH